MKLRRAFYAAFFLIGALGTLVWGQGVTPGGGGGTSGGGDGAIVDGVSASIKGTVLDLANANPLTAAIVDTNGDQITAFGGGVQYTEGDIDTTLTGTMLMWEDSGNTVVAASVVKPLPSQLISGLGFYTEGDVDATLGGVVLLAEGAGNTAIALPGTVADGLLVNLGANNDVLGTKTNNNAAPGATNIGVLAAIANASTPSYSEGNLVGLSVNLSGELRVAGAGGGTQYTEGDPADTTLTGTVALMEIAGDLIAPLQGTVADGLLVNLGANNDINVTQFNGQTVTLGAGAVAAGTLRITHASDDPVTTAVQLIDNAMSGAGFNITQMAGANLNMGAGAVSTGTQRATLASDDPAVVALQLLDNAANQTPADNYSNPTGALVVWSLNGCWDSAGGNWDRCPISDGGSGAASANTMRTIAATDSPEVTALQIIDDWDESDRAKVNLIVGQAGIAAGAGTVGVTVPRVTLANDGPGLVVDDAGFTAATTILRAIGFVADEGSIDSVDEDNLGAPRMTLDRIAYAAPAAVSATTQGTLTCYITSAASTNATNCKNAAGNVYGFRLVNTTSTLYYIRMYNLSSAPTCSSSTGFVESIPVPHGTGAGAGLAMPNAVGQAYGTGIGFCLTGGGSSTDNTNAATGVYVTVLYK